MFDSVIFDLDGTLWDSTETVAESWNMSLRRRGFSAPHITGADVAGIMGMTEREIAEKIFAPFFGAEAGEVCTLCLREEVEYIAIHGGRLYPGIEDMLKALAPLPLFIVSNCQTGYIEAFLHYTGFGKYIRDFECIGRSGLSKAENIALVAQRNGLQRPLYVGDTASDEKSAEAAGCAFFHAGYGFGMAAAPLERISRPLELCEKLPLYNQTQV